MGMYNIIKHGLGKGGEHLKVQVICDKDKRSDLEAELSHKGFEIVEKSNYLFIDQEYTDKRYIFAKDRDKNLSLLQYSDILYFESFNKITEVVTSSKRLEVKEKLYELEDMLFTSDFIRVNKSTIVNLMKIEQIIPWIGSKFVLELINGHKLDVTRSYYSDFKKRLRI